MFRRLFVFAWLGSLPAIVAAMPANAPTGAPTPAAGAASGAGAEGSFAYLTRDGASVKVPLFSPESENVAVARVEDETIALSDLTRALAAAHGGMDSSASRAGKRDFTAILDRLIEVRLVVTEAREMGIDELPEVKKAVADFETATGQELLKARVTAGVKADPKEVARAYRNAVREWKVKSVLFGGELEAKQHGPKLKEQPKAFDAVAKQLVAEKKAKGSGEGGYLPRDSMLPQVRAALEKLKVGEVSAPVRVPDGFAVMQLMEIRHPDDPKAKAEAERASIQGRQVKALSEYYAGLVKRYAKVDRALLKAVDYHAKKPGLEALKKDQRVLAQIEGGKPITVGELTAEIMAGFFHGVDRAAKEKKINPKKTEIFDGLLAQRVVPMQVAAEKIPETAEFKRRVADYRTGILFSKFIEKAVAPTVKAGEDEARKYHAEHRKDFMYPTFYKLESVAFSKVKDAEGAVQKLRSGTDFKWLNANAEGQIPPAKRKLAIEGTLAATALPKEIAAALAGAKKGDYRLHAGPESQYYAIRVIDVVGATEQPFEKVRDDIMQRLENEGITSGVKRWAAIIRKARKVEVYITRIGS
jgi:parvulin-like peptidyl-prolyl isomerase